jgi:hypothetical protein
MTLEFLNRTAVALCRASILTLYADNLPETGKRQHENKGTCAPRWRQSENDAIAI